ncbi:zinc ribbon domain-containing protein [soil metagenome]
MPIYEYQCRSCDHYLDALQKLSDPLLTDCPACGKPALRRLISAPNFRLKGGGWYETDFKSDNRRNIADSGEPAEKAGKADKADKSDKQEARPGDSKQDAKPKQDAVKASNQPPPKKPSGDDKVA